MKILHVITGLSMGEAEMALLRSSSEFAARGHSVRVLVLRRVTDVAPDFARQKINVVFVTDLLRSPMLALQLLFWRPDAVIAWLPMAHFISFFIALFLRPQALIWNVRQILNQMEQIPRSSRILLWLSSHISWFSDGIIFTSERARADHLKIGYRSKATVVIADGFFLPELPTAEQRAIWNDEAGLDPKASKIIFVGHNHPDKGFEVFVRAALDVSQFQLPSHRLQFLVIGRGFERGREHEYLDADQIGTFQFFGNLRPGALNRLYALSDLFVSSSISEGFSNAIGEAMSFAIVPVVTDVGDSGRLVRPFGAVVAADDARALSAAITPFLRMGPGDRARLGQRCRERIATQYSSAICADQYEMFMSHLIKRRTNAPA